MTTVFDDQREFRSPTETLAQPWDRLAEWLATQDHELCLATPPRQFANGLGNINYLVRVDGEPRVLRRPPAGPLPRGGNDMSREHRVLEGLCDVFPLVPRPLLLCEDDAVLGVPFILMEYRSGLVVRSTLPDQLAAHASDLSEMLVDILVSIHRLVPEEAGLGELGRPEGFLERTVAGWAKRADVATDHIPPAAVGELATWLGDNLVPDGAPTLIHNDFKLNNVILTEDDPTRAKAVIDWDMTTRGDPLFDLATLLSYWVELGDPPAMHELLQMPTAQQGFLTRQQVAELYAERTGRDLSDFVFHRVLAMFKLGVVFLQLYARYRRGTTTDERFAGFRKTAEGLLDFALEASTGRVF